MKTSHDYAEMGLAAMIRAAKQARQDAALRGLKIPVWQDGRIVYIDPAKSDKAPTKAKSGNQAKTKHLPRE